MKQQVQIKKKKSWLQFYKNEIKIISLILLIGVGGLFTYNYRNTILNFLNKYHISLGTLFGCIVIFVTGIFIVKNLIIFFIYLRRHLFIPLTHEELEANHIYTFKDYNQFLMEYFFYLPILKKAREEIKKSVLEEFHTENKLYFENMEYIQNLKELHFIYSVFTLLFTGLSFGALSVSLNGMVLIGCTIVISYLLNTVWWWYLSDGCNFNYFKLIRKLTIDTLNDK